MSEAVCPWWMGYVLLNPIRRLIQNPEKILGAYVSKGRIPAVYTPFTLCLTSV